MTGFGKIRLNAANNFFSITGESLMGDCFFFEIFFYGRMDRHQLALAYDGSCKLWRALTHTRRLETLACWTRVRRVAKNYWRAFTNSREKTVAN